jgi:nucleotide-binding universal stress UspA family protein
VFPNTLAIDQQEDLVMNVKDLQHFFDATLHIVWINTPANFTSDVVTHKRMKAFAERHTLRKYTINIFNHFSEDEGIIEFTRMINGDMIAMGTHGHRGVSHALSGSIAEDVVNHTEHLIWTYTLKNEPVTA